MATETVAPPPIPTTDDEQIEKKVREEKKEDDVPLTKENGEEILKTEDLVSLEIPPKPEAFNHEKIEPPIDVAEKIVDAPVSDIPLVDAMKVANDSSPDILEQVVEAEKNADAAVSDVSLVEESKVECDPIPDIPEPVVDAVKITEEVESSTECVVREAPKEPAIEIIEGGQVDGPKTVDAPQSLYEAIEKPEEPLKVTAEKESVETVLTEIKEPEPDSLEVQKLEVATDEVDEKPGELSEVTEEVEMKVEEVELEKSVQGEMVKDEGSAADKVEPIPSLEEGKTEAEKKPSVEVEETPEQPKIEEEKTHDEVAPEKSLEDGIVKDEESSADKVKASTIIEEGKTDKDYESSQGESPEEVLVNRDGADYCVPADTTEPVASEEPKKEVAEVDVVEKLPAEEAAVEIEKVGGEVKDLETEETEKETVVTDYSTEPIQEEEKGLNGIEVVEKVAEEISVKLGTDGEENVESLEIEGKEKCNVAAEESTQPLELDEKKEVSGLDEVEKLTEEAAADVEQVGEKNVETEDGKSVITEGIIQPILEDGKKELSGADVIEKLAEEIPMKLEEVEEENMGKVAETIECEKKDVIIEDSSEPILVDKKEASSGFEVVEKVAEDARVEFEKVGEENETKNVQCDDSEGKNVLDEVLTQKDKAVDTSCIITPSVVIKKSFEGSRKDVEPAAEKEKAEYIKDETPGTVETKQEDNVERKQDEVNTLVTEPLGESKPYEPEVKGDEPVILEKIEDVAECDPAAENEKAEHLTPGTVETKKEDNVEETQDEVSTLVTEPLGESKPPEPEMKGYEPVTLEKTIEDVATSDKNIELPAKDGDDTKSSEDLPKEVPAKPSQKQSTTILSKVKQTLVKAKRVITGKSPSSKTPASETKDDIKGK